MTPRSSLAFLLAALVLVMAGCGDGRPKRVHVSGRVLIDNQPLTTGFIRIVPADARPATGEIGPDGRFTLTTFDGEDGCVPGTHPIAVVATQSVGSTAIRHLVPKHYHDFATSETTVTIEGATDSLEINLTWAGGQPFVERQESGGDFVPE